MTVQNPSPTRVPVGAAPPDDAEFESFSDRIAAHSAADANGIAFMEGDRVLNWSGLSERVGAVAGALVAAGIQPGDRVAILSHPSLEYVECLFGIVVARACAVPLAVSASVQVLEAMLADCDAKLLFVDPDAGAEITGMALRFAQRAPAGAVWFGDASADRVAYRDWLARAPAGAPDRKSQPDDAFNIIYSSGTTGVPKGIVHLHRMRRRQAGRGGFSLGKRSISLLSTPMYSNTTIAPLLGTLVHGGCSILMRKFDAGRYLQIARERRVTHTMLVPVQYKRILAHPDFGRSDLSAFELKQSTGAPMDAAVKREILDRWPGRFIEVYGLTEGGCTCILDAGLHPDKLATVGPPAPGNEVFMIDAAGKKLPRGETGEVVGRSPFMMAGYHNRPDATADMRWVDDEGRVHHRTGDIGRFDPDGFLILLDRKKDVIISGGNNVYAADLEAVLAGHPEVYESAVIGVPSDAWGETPLALVVARPGAQLTSEALCAWVNSLVGKTQRLSAVELRDALPRSALGKMLKRDLRAPYWDKARSPGRA